MIPAWWKTHTATVEPYEGGGAHGPVLGTAVPVECSFEDKLQLVRSSAGEEVVSSSVMRCDPDVVAPPGSRVTIAGRVSTVITTGEHTTGGFSLLDHLEVYLK